MLTKNEDLRGIGIQIKAAELLGLDDDAEKRLFDPIDSRWQESEWPEKFIKAYKKAKTAKGRARVAFNRIEHFIKTDGAE